VLTESGAVYTSGSAESGHFPTSTDRGKYGEYQVFKGKEEKEKIVDIQSGKAFTLFVTESGKVWCSGELLGAIEIESNEASQLALPKGKICKRVWAADSLKQKLCVAFLELEDTKSGTRRLYSIGKSEGGMLGQGQDVHVCKAMQEMDYPKDLVFSELSVGTDYVLALDSEG